MALQINCDKCGCYAQDVSYWECNECNDVVCDNCADRAGTKKGIQNYRDGEGFWKRAGKVLTTIASRACPRCLGEVRLIRAAKK